MKLICCLLTSFGATRPGRTVLMNFSLFVNHKRWKMHEHSHSKAINIRRWRVSRATATESSLWTWNDLWFVYTSLLRIDFFLLNIVWHMVCTSFHCQTSIECWRCCYVIDFSLSSLSSCLRVHASECCINQHFSTSFPPFRARVHENCKRNAMNPLGNRFYVCLEPITDRKA